MAIQTKTKPTAKAAAAPAKGKAAPAKAAAKKPAAKASEGAAAKPAKPTVVFEANTLVKFNGYRSNMDKDEVVFAEGDILYIVEVEDDAESGILYSAVHAKDIAAYNEDPESVNGGQVAPAEVSELKGSALDKAQDTYMPIVIMDHLAELLAESDGNAIEAAIGLNRAIQANYFWMGGALAQVLQTGAYLKANGGDYAGEEAFNEFCQAEFAFKASKGRALARIYKTFSQIEGFDADKLASLDWSKVAIAERFVTPENVDEVLDVADNSTQRDLAVTLKQKFVNTESGKTASGRGASRGASITKKTLTFKLDEDAAETVQLVIQQCMKQSGFEPGAEGLALERILIEWADTHVEADSAKKRIQSKAAKAAKARAETAPKAAPAKAASSKVAAKPGAKPAAKK
jgi:hypothetical protein